MIRRHRRVCDPGRTALFTIVALGVALFAPPAVAQEASPARTDVASYDIAARLDPDSKQIHGRATVTYRNPSPDRLTELWLKLYLNAFRSPDTVWMREAARDGPVSFDPRHPGWIRLERLADTATGESLLPPDAAEGETVLRVPLTRPLEPGGALALTVEWTSQLPLIVARTGYVGEFVLAGQWYPKLAVYDRGRWDAEPWHANAEFFADFGTYTLDLTVPAGYVTGATGVRESVVNHADGTQTARYRAESVSDVAWTAWPEYRVVHAVVEAAGRQTEIELLAPRDLRGADERYLSAAQVALDLFGRWFGPYPWPRLSIVVPPPEAAAAGGMEYPTFVTVDGPPDLPLGLGRRIFLPEIVTVHEIAHQWFPLQVASDEGREAWLDEGFAEYATIRALDALLGAERSLLDFGPLRLGYLSLHRLQFGVAAAREPLTRTSWEYEDSLAYGATVYSKGALALLSLERTFGEQRFLAALRSYADRWRWRHPTTADLQASLEGELGESLDWFFRPLVHGTALIEYEVDHEPEHGLLARRVGDVQFPLQPLLAYRDGRTERVRWAGAAPLSVDQAGLACVVLDPERRLLLELDTLDDGLSTQPAIDRAADLAGRLLGAFQVMLQLVGHVG